MYIYVVFYLVLANTEMSLLIDPNVRPSIRNSLGNSSQSFAPVNLKVDWQIVDLTLGR